MDSNMVQVIARAILKALGGVLVQRGYTDASGAEAVVGGLLVVVGVLWSKFHDKKLLDTPPPGAGPVE